jgi:hypothetical protein
MSASAAVNATPHDDELDAALAQILGAHIEATLAEARISASKIRMYAALYLAAEQRTARDCAPSISASDRQREFARHLRSMAGEYAASKQLSDVTIVSRAHSAHDLVTKFPDWLDALAEGEVQAGHTRALLAHHTPLDPEQYDEFGRLVLRHARSHTVHSTELFAKATAAKLMREAHEEAYRREFERRRVTVEAADFGMSYLTAYLPSAAAAAIDAVLTQDARALRIGGHAVAGEQGDGEQEAEADPRTIAQLRTDVFTDLLLTGTPQAILDSPSAGAARVTATVSLVVPVLALRDPELGGAFSRAGGCGAQGGVPMLNGVQPLSAEEAREWAADAELET